MTFGVLTLIVACGLAGPLLSGATRLAVPVVVGEIAAGVVIGRTGFGEINTNDPTLVFLADAGFAMLMFVVGTRLPLRDPGLRRALRGAAIATVLSFAIAVPVGWLLADVTAIKHPALFALLLAAASSAVVMPILHERGLTGPGMLLAIAWIALVDIATIVALPLALEPSRAFRIAIGGIVVTAAAVGIFLVLRAIRRHPVVRRLRHDSRDREWALDLRLSLLALFGLSALATWFGTSVLIAGFAAGMVIALAGEPRRLAQQLLGIAEGFFVPFFFVSLGARLNFRSLASSRSEILLALVLVVAIVVCHVVIAVVMRMPWPAGLLASAQLGLPAGVVALGLTEGLITPGQGAAIVASAVVTLGVSSIGAAMLHERLASNT
ncbi:MAG TPA: cation:proton antiporter [Gaiellales bacterium]|jgi:Kef-type K+ transport system membrane component KefB|nr:cation:proton antiporter [Gaiellales bacterium]